MAKKVPDRQIAGLKAHAEAKNKETIDKVNKAIDILKSKNVPINFETVSKEAGVSRATIYKNEQLKERILSIRAMSKESPLIMKITSAYANKLLKSLEEDKKFWENKEESSSTYVAANNEEPVIQEYDYREVSDTIAEIDSKIAILKHAINLNNVAITNQDEEGVFLRAIAAGWGNSGSNGGHVTLNAYNQTIDGDIIVDEISSLNMYLKQSSVFNGSIQSEGDVYVEIENGSKWVLSADSYVSSLTCDESAIDLNGYKLYIDGVEYDGTSSSVGQAVVVEVSSSSKGPGANGNHQPPAKP